MNVKKDGWSASKRVKTREFIRNRAIVRKRDPCCVRCFTLFNRTVPAEDCDHWISQANGGTDDLTNLWMLCRDECHKAKTVFEKSGISGFPEVIDWSTGWAIEEPDWQQVIRQRHEDWQARMSI